jgi:hypothetical protein
VHLLLHFWSWPKSTLFNGQLSFERDNFLGNSKTSYKTKTNRTSTLFLKILTFLRFMQLKKVMLLLFSQFLVLGCTRPKCIFINICKWAKCLEFQYNHCYKLQAQLSPQPVNQTTCIIRKIDPSDDQLQRY